MKEKFKGFNLAEILITLGVIGVVAAMTLPTLIHNYQKKTYVEGLKVAYSMLSQGIQKAMADDEVTNFKDTELYKAAEWKNYKGKTANKNNVFVPLNKYYKGIKVLAREDVANDVTSATIEDKQVCEELVSKYTCGWYLGDKNKCFCPAHDIELVFANGMTGTFVFYDYGYDYGYIQIDINGRKGPNIMGRDVFEFSISPDGQLWPCGSEVLYRAMAEYQNKDLETVLSERHWSRMDACSNTTTLNGLRCTARVIEEGWKMNY